MSYPINLNVEDKICVVLGGGHVAFRKICGLIEANARIILIAPEICSDIKNLVDINQVEWRQQNYSSGCIPNGFIFIAATNDEEVNKLAAMEAAKKNMLVNQVTNKSANFTIPSVIRQGNLTLTISTEGLSPALSKYIRLYLENQFNENFAIWLERLSKIRDEVKNKIKTVQEREQFWRNVMSDENFLLVQSGELDKAEVNICNALNSYRSKSQDGSY